MVIRKESVRCMLTIERRQEILEMLNKKGSVKVSDLVEQYQVGKETIRRDLKALSDQWNVEVVYGGAHLKNLATGTPIKEETIVQKRETNSDLKNEIAKRAAELIEPGDVIALNSGSTVECILNYIADKTPLSILTVNVNIAAKAAMIPGVDVYIPAGKIRGKSGMIISSDAEDYIKRFAVQKCFFGVSAISTGSQITHTCIEEVPNNRSLMSISEKIYVLADHTKFDKKSLCRLARFDEMTGIITDEKVNSSYQAYFDNYGVEVITVND